MSEHETLERTQAGFDIGAVGGQVDGMAAEEMLDWAKETFGDGLYASSSFGVDSALLLDLLHKSELDIPVVTVDTGFWFDETHDFKDELVNRYDIDLRVFTPSAETIEQIKETRLWETDKTEYNKLTKLEPMARAIEELGVSALIAGIRGYQNENRAGMERIGTGRNGEVRVHPLLDWTEEEVIELFEQEKLPRHPLFYQGYDSVGDWTTTRPGRGREGRHLGEQSECGLHLPPESGHTALQTS